MTQDQFNMPSLFSGDRSIFELDESIAESIGHRSYVCDEGNIKDITYVNNNFFVAVENNDKIQIFKSNNLDNWKMIGNYSFEDLSNAKFFVGDVSLILMAERTWHYNFYFSNDYKNFKKFSIDTDQRFDGQIGDFVSVVHTDKKFYIVSEEGIHEKYILSGSDLLNMKIVFSITPDSGLKCWSRSNIAFCNNKLYTVIEKDFESMLLVLDENMNTTYPKANISSFVNLVPLNNKIYISDDADIRVFDTKINKIIDKFSNQFGDLEKIRVFNNQTFAILPDDDGLHFTKNMKDWKTISADISDDIRFAYGNDILIIYGMGDETENYLDYFKLTDL